jgi:hypothetical protein
MRFFDECPLWPVSRHRRKRMRTRTVVGQWLDQPQFQTGPIGVRVQHGPKLPPL